MDDKLIQDNIDLLKWVKQWYYSPEHVKRFDDMIARLEVALQSAQANASAKEK